MSYEECGRHGTDVTNDYCRLCEAEIQLRTRAVLPDEIDEMPEEPAPDEVLVERVKSAAVRAISEGGSMVGASVPEAIARAVLAETTAWNSHIEEKRGQAFAKMSEDWEASQKRVAELETELKETAAEGVRRANESYQKGAADLATVTRERDELKARHGTDCVSAFARIDSLTRELAEAKRDEHSACERGNRLAQELAEAREELRSAKSRMWELGHENDRMSGELAIHRVREVVLRGQYRGYVSDGDCAMLDALDAHREKTPGPSGLTASHGRAEVPADGSANPGPEGGDSGHFFETAPRLTKGVRYRVVEQVQPGSGFRVGDEHSATGDEERVVGRGDGGWYLLSRSHIHRVVRVEPEKTQSKCPQCGELDGAHKLDCSFREPSQWKFGAKSDDGGGERSGQVKCDQDDCPGHATPEERPCRWEPGVSKEPDDGPPRAGDVVRVDEAHTESSFPRNLAGCELTVDSFRVDDGPGEFSGWQHVGFKDGNVPGLIPHYPYAVRVKLVRRAGQPEAKAVLPIDAEDERVVDALVHRRTADRAEKPLLGPHTGTVADLEAFLEWALPHAWREWREIRAWRAGSRK